MRERRKSFFLFLFLLGSWLSLFLRLILQNYALRCVRREGDRETKEDNDGLYIAGSRIAS